MASISFYSKDAYSDEVLRQLQSRLPDHQILEWSSVQRDSDQHTYAICWHPPDAFFDGTTQLQAIFSLGAGVDHLLAHPNLPTSVPIVRLSDAGMGEKIAEYALYGVLRTHRAFDRYQTLQRKQRWQPQPDRHAQDYRVGILGYGVIGRAVAQKLHSAGYQVSAYKRSPATDSAPFPVLSGGQRSQFLKDLDVLVCVLPLTAQTTNMIDLELLSCLPTGAHLINVGRGIQVVENDLLSALDNGQLGSALLDVCVEEPLPAEHPLWSHEKVTITPHVAGPTQLQESVEQIAMSIDQLESGADVKGLAGWVDTKQGY